MWSQQFLRVTPNPWHRRMMIVSFGAVRMGTCLGALPSKLAEDCTLLLVPRQALPRFFGKQWTNYKKLSPGLQSWVGILVPEDLGEHHQPNLLVKTYSSRKRCIPYSSYFQTNLHGASLFLCVFSGMGWWEGSLWCGDFSGWRTPTPLWFQSESKGVPQMHPAQLKLRRTMAVETFAVGWPCPKYWRYCISMIGALLPQASRGPLASLLTIVQGSEKGKAYVGEVDNFMETMYKAWAACALPSSVGCG